MSEPRVTEVFPELSGQVLEAKKVILYEKDGTLWDYPKGFTYHEIVKDETFVAIDTEEDEYSLGRIILFAKND